MLQKIKKFTDKKTRKLWQHRINSRVIILWHRIFREQKKQMDFGGKTVGNGAPVFIIAEIGVNHEGKLDEAKNLMELACKSGAHAVKFQKRELSTTYQKKVVEHPELYDQSLRYLIPILKEFEFGEKEFIELHAHAKKLGIILFATPFDEPSVDFLERVVNPPLYKVSSADMVNFPLLEKLVTTHKPLILSTGMSSLDEIDDTVGFLNKKKTTFALLHCQSTYPAARESLNLNFMKVLMGRFGVPVGYSGHEVGFDETLASVALGAKIIERHITFNREAHGPDHAASLLPEEFSEMVKKIRDLETALGSSTRQITRGEVMNRLALRKSLVATRPISAGTKITRDMVAAKSPSLGLSPQKLYKLVGHTIERDIEEDDFFLEDDLRKKTAPGKIDRLRGPWGLKARFFELDALLQFEPKPDFLEFHLTDKDLDFVIPQGKKYPFGLYIHAPEYNDRLPVDLASENDEIWEKSIELMQKTIDKTREIAKHFVGTPRVIIHVGGMSLTSHADPEKLLERGIKAFKRLEWKGVEVMPENLPAFGWFFGGLWYINIFGKAEDMIRFCDTLKLKMCFDTSHAWLYTQYAGVDYLEYVKEVAPYTTHLHISDGRGTHKEGLQIGEGDVPFEKTFEILERLMPDSRNVSWVPEIWQGHLYDYREFRIALSSLSRYPFLKDIR